MKRKLTSFTIITLILFLFISIFINSSIVGESISFSINLFIKNIFPSLFPMFILSNILISIGIPEFLGCIFSKLCNKLFKTKGISSFVFFMSMLSGFPSSAKYIKELLDKKLINEIDANKILSFTFFSNPLFIINTLGIMFLNNKKIGYLILISHFLGNIIVGLLFRNLYVTKDKEKYISFKNSLINLNYKINNTNIIKEFLSSINNTLLTLLNVFGTITCFLIIISLINIKINPLNDTIIKGLLEMTTGLKYLSLLNVDFKLKVYISTFLLSFGGISIHSQMFNILNNYKIKYYPFLIARIIHACSSTLIIFLFM